MRVNKPRQNILLARAFVRLVSVGLSYWQILTDAGQDVKLVVARFREIFGKFFRGRGGVQLLNEPLDALANRTKRSAAEL